MRDGSTGKVKYRILIDSKNLNKNNNINFTGNQNNNFH
jgi:hypothetical protein